MGSDDACCSGGGCCGGRAGATQDERGRISRREFLARGAAGFSAGFLLAGLPRWSRGEAAVKLSPHLIPKDKGLNPGWIKSLLGPSEPAYYDFEAARTVGMPCGGIGAGQLFLCGDGTLGLWEIFNEHHVPPHGEESYRRRTIPKPVEHGISLFWWGSDGNGEIRRLDHSGFDGTAFRNMHPVGVVQYGSEGIPVRATLEGFSPFIPGNAADSALPATFMVLTVENMSEAPVEVGTVSWLENPVARGAGERGFEVERASEVQHRPQGGRIVHTAVAKPETQPAPGRDPIVYQDFEGNSFGDWKAAGTAFGDSPTTGNLPAQQNVSGWEGTGFAGSFRDRDAAVGRLVSPEFTVSRRFINFKVGGGHDAQVVGIRLIVDDEVVRRAAANDKEALTWQTWFVGDLEGQQAHLEIIDNSKGGWGHIQVDHVEFSDSRHNDSYQSAEELPDFGTMAWGLDRETLEEADAAELLDRLKPVGTAPAPESDLSKRLVMKPITLQPGDEATITHVLTWHFPNTVQPDREAGHVYADRFKDAPAVLDYVLAERDRLVQDTFLWRDTWYDSSLPWWLLERIHMTSCCLATGTTMWWRNGRFWAFEGVTCCVGTCTHVYNYVQTVARLFPELERNIRENQDLKPGVGLEDSGLVGFRHDGKYAADGQCGTVLKVYREHQMSADDAFLKRNWAAVKKVVDYAIQQDGNSDGILEGSQHNTYDVNFFGANSFVGGLYLTALRAAEEMALELGEREYAKKLRGIYEKGRAWTEENLWTGEYFKQIVDLVEHPEHQYGDGCLSDQVFGQNWAHQLGLGYIYSPDKVKRALQSVWNYNWAPDLGVYNAVYPPMRMFAEAQEAGLFNCTWPHGEHLDKGVLYRDEVWSGVEYQVASHMVYEGMITEGLAMTRAVHDRYQPERRNPFNELECSDFYSRAMASWGLLLALSGFQYHGPKGWLEFKPCVTPENFRCAFNTAEGWGQFSQVDADGGRQWKLTLKWGKLRLSELRLDSAGKNVKKSATLAGKDLPAEWTEKDGVVALKFAEPVLIQAGEELSIS